MCSVDPDEITEMTRATDGLDISSGNVMCRRCNTEKAVVVLRIKDAYCRECFLSYFVHKFRSTIGKSKQIRPGDRILIATSGGTSSSALLHLVREGLDESSHKKLRFEPACIYIDESCLSDSPDIGPELTQQVCKGVLGLKFPCYLTSLEQIMSSQPPVPVLISEHFKARHKDTEVYRPMRELLQNEIQYYNDLHDILAVQAPSLKYKGSSIITCTEQFVMGLQKEFPATIPTIFRTGDKLVSTSSEISKCSTPELNGYNETNFSSICAMCGLILDTMQSESSAVHATLVSQRLSCTVAPSVNLGERLTDATNGLSEQSSSTSSPTHLQTSHEHHVKSINCSSDLSSSVGTSCDCSQQTRCCSTNKDKQQLNASNSVHKNILDSYLCYGCRIIVRELEEVNLLPVKIRGSVAEQERLKRMREKIEDFLL
ncbi:cytoplasmic tRNA 2-thiolation protein 2-like isoform X2 [Macrobrachium nipponense]|uniref:cytoplasmic tRNA 2-thiolation protein 2-like isoform X2 n=1 Tax=Macrobrachium nipponense TaxID=159736 RepID=UPI0030C8B122